MKPLAQLSRQLPDPSVLEELTDALEEKYTVRDTPPQTATLTFYDSFDWRLYAEGLLCFAQDNRLHLTDMTGRDLVSSVALSGEAPRFCEQLPESGLHKTLSPILEMRALLPQSRFSATSRRLRILNKDEKTVAFLCLSELNPGDKQPVVCSVHLQEVRGYGKWFQRLAQDLERFGSPQSCTKEQELKTVLAAQGRAPQDYSSKFNVTLQEDMDALTAAKTIYRDLLHTMRRNEQGILDDLDSEFLHDFRVAIRRTRSGLAMIKNVLDPEITARFKEEFRYLGQVTGPVRDLDVYLLMEEEYKAKLPDHLQEGLRSFFDDLAGQRQEEQEKLIQALQSSRYKSIIKDWKKYLRRKEKAETAEDAPTIGRMAKKIIRKRFQRVLRDGRAIDAGSPDESLHRLRIQGKKLRYCLEFFSSLYPTEEMKRLIKQLKKLQNNLGLFNDLSVQQDMLDEYLGGLEPDSGKAKKTGAAIGGLLTDLYHEQQQVRNEFEQTFCRFSSEENISLYEKLFAAKKKCR